MMEKTSQVKLYNKKENPTRCAHDELIEINISTMPIKEGLATYLCGVVQCCECEKEFRAMKYMSSKKGGQWIIQYPRLCYHEQFIVPYYKIFIPRIIPIKNTNLSILYFKKRRSCVVTSGDYYAGRACCFKCGDKFDVISRVKVTTIDEKNALRDRKTYWEIVHSRLSLS
jgi:hypothetical protein